LGRLNDDRFVVALAPLLLVEKGTFAVEARCRMTWTAFITSWGVLK